MNTHLKLIFVISAIAMPFLTAAEPEVDFTSLFDGKSLDGWKSNEEQQSFSVEDGAIKANGKRCHLFYEGLVNGAKFKDFELRLDVMTRPNSNGGLFFHTVFQQAGWPSGYEVQVNNTQKDPLKSGSLYKVVDNLVPFADDQWMKYVIVVKDGKVTVVINDKPLVNYQTEAASTKLLPEGGALAIQSHDPGSTTFYKNIRVKILKILK